jgi:hypothetical protein
MTNEPEYDACLSFAGEQRPYVEQVAKILRQHGVHVFYDDFEKVALWGKDLYEHLDWVYQKAARYCVLFASADYARKSWPTHERRSAYARAFSESDAYILPARFDDTEIPGLRPTIGYVDLRRTTPSELAELIIGKLFAPARGLHFHTWPAVHSGLVSIWVRPAPTTVGQNHEIRVRWGPWYQRVRAVLSKTGLTLVTGKAIEEVAVPCQVEVIPPAHVFFGIGEVADPDREVLDIAIGWTTDPSS